MRSVLATSPVCPVFEACPPNRGAIQKKMLKLAKDNTTTSLSRLRPTSRLSTDAGSWMRATGVALPPEKAKGDRG